MVISQAGTPGLVFLFDYKKEADVTRALLDNCILILRSIQNEWDSKTHHGEFDPGSEGTLAACITHASRTVVLSSDNMRVANG